ERTHSLEEGVATRLVGQLREPCQRSLATRVLALTAPDFGSRTRFWAAAHRPIFALTLNHGADIVSKLPRVLVLCDHQAAAPDDLAAPNPPRMSVRRQPRRRSAPLVDSVRVDDPRAAAGSRLPRVFL